MKNVFEHCMEYFQSDEAKRNMKQSILTPLGDIIYQEMYFYVWVICFYHIVLILLIVLILALLLRKQQTFSHEFFV